jgi:hypothetical protein
MAQIYVKSKQAQQGLAFIFGFFPFVFSARIRRETTAKIQV